MILLHSGWLEPEQFLALCDSRNCLFFLVLSPAWDSFLPCTQRSVLSQRPEGTQPQISRALSVCTVLFLSALCPEDSSPLASLNLNYPEFIEVAGLCLSFTSIFCCLKRLSRKQVEDIALFSSSEKSLFSTFCCLISENCCFIYFFLSYLVVLSLQNTSNPCYSIMARNRHLTVQLRY